MCVVAVWCTVYVGIVYLYKVNVWTGAKVGKLALEYPRCVSASSTMHDLLFNVHTGFKACMKSLWMQVPAKLKWFTVISLAVFDLCVVMATNLAPKQSDCIKIW